MALIMTFVLNLGGWLDITLLAIDGLREGVSGNENVWALLDTVWEKIQAIAQQLFQRDESTYLKLNGSLAEVLVWGGALITLLLGTAVEGKVDMHQDTIVPVFFRPSFFRRR